MSTNIKTLSLLILIITQKSSNFILISYSKTKLLVVFTLENDFYEYQSVEFIHFVIIQKPRILFQFLNQKRIKNVVPFFIMFTQRTQTRMVMPTKQKTTAPTTKPTKMTSDRLNSTDQVSKRPRAQQAHSSRPSRASR